MWVVAGLWIPAIEASLKFVAWEMRIMASWRFGRSAIAIAAGLVLGAGAIAPMAIAGIAEPEAAARAIATDKQTERKRVLVLDFYYGDTGSNYWSGYSYGGSSAGVGISQQLIEQLLESGQVRVADRSVVADRNWGEVSTSQAIEAGRLAGVDYVIIGTVREFNVENRSTDISFGGIGGNSSRQTARVALSVRVIETATGDIIATANGAAEREASSGGGSFLGLGASSRSSNDEAMMSEAVSEAIDALATELLNKL
jgi:curli biogenesis system outer membrane secretion channel CsgG